MPHAPLPAHPDVASLPWGGAGWGAKWLLVKNLVAKWILIFSLISWHYQWVIIEKLVLRSWDTPGTVLSIYTYLFLSVWLGVYSARNWICSVGSTLESSCPCGASILAERWADWNNHTNIKSPPDKWQRREGFEESGKSSAPHDQAVCWDCHTYSFLCAFQQQYEAHLCWHSCLFCSKEADS